MISEILKSYRNEAKEPLLWYYRDRNANEIDLLIEENGKLHPIEIKRSVNPGTEIVKAFSIFERASIPIGEGAIICMREQLSAIDSNHFIIPIWYI